MHVPLILPLQHQSRHCSSTTARARVHGHDDHCCSCPLRLSSKTALATTKAHRLSEGGIRQGSTCAANTPAASCSRAGAGRSGPSRTALSPYNVLRTWHQRICGTGPKRPSIQAPHRRRRQAAPRPHGRPAHPLPRCNLRLHAALAPCRFPTPPPRPHYHLCCPPRPPSPSVSPFSAPPRRRHAVHAVQAPSAVK